MARAGKFRHRIEHQVNTPVVDAFNESVPSWATVERPWANIVPLTGRELVEARAAEERVTHQIEVRFGGVDWTAEHRAVWTDRATERVFNILSAIERDTTRRVVVMMAEEVR